MHISNKSRVGENDSRVLGAVAVQQMKWQEMIQKAILSIVSIRFSQVVAFDTEAPDAAEASGFVVDAKKGIILTNRHVVCSGPFIGEAIFHDHEEVAVLPIYRDPVSVRVHSSKQMYLCGITNYPKKNKRRYTISASSGLTLLKSNINPW